MQAVCKAPNCGVRFEAQRPTAKYCSPRCRTRASRAPKGAAPAGAATVSPLPSAIGGVAGATRGELERLGRLDTPEGQAVLVLAGRLDRSDQETGAGLAALTREFRAAYEAATASAGEQEDELDEIFERALKLVSGGRV